MSSLKDQLYLLSLNYSEYSSYSWRRRFIEMAFANSMLECRIPAPDNLKHNQIQFLTPPVYSANDPT